MARRTFSPEMQERINRLWRQDTLERVAVVFVLAFVGNLWGTDWLDGLADLVGSGFDLPDASALEAAWRAGILAVFVLVKSVAAKGVGDPASASLTVGARSNSPPPTAVHGRSSGGDPYA